MLSQTDLTASALDLIALQEAVVYLEPECFEYAVQVSQQAATEAHQWRSYLNSLALCGFLHWLKEQVPDLSADTTLCTLLQPQYASVLDAVCHLRVGDFTLCLLVTESVANEQVRTPRAVIELPEFIAHFYVLIEIQEEQEQMILRGCLRYDQLQHFRENLPLQAQSDWTYKLPLDWFDPNYSHLLLYLRFLEASTLALPTALNQEPSEPLAEVALSDVLPQLKSGNQLWQVLTWEQGIEALTNPPLLNLLYQLQTQPEQSASITQSISHLLLRLKHQVLNVWNWSQDRLDETAEALSWSSPQVLSPAVAMRRSPEKVEAALQDLVQQQGIEIPNSARYAYTNFESSIFQLCAVTWHTPNTLEFTAQQASEWALLLILVAQPGKVMPLGTKLQVSNTTVLGEVKLETSDLYLYLLVEGQQNEAFTVTILPPNDLPTTLPAFVCHSNHI
ncbi:MAG TPA: DUF1822 family protein [Leptolyngbyaceae cyanobacterium M33_DOE_097]|uniref:DUF1822 family protein n=1 Tax=Oscillatoriales cyanobacterium SpSt-418 TaxID=2282169 RepID=A0A7C3PGW3_9CYAN|nr:DUF1822 family protein [Leptolyngbyaceae cyanobacterium M33_DOE_097]